MMDARNVPVSENDAQAIAQFEAALQSFQSYVDDPVALIDRALETAPDFVLAHLFRSAAIYLTSERRYEAAALRSLDRAIALAGQANERERLLTQAIAHLLAGSWEQACHDMDGVLRRYPLDVFALQVGHLMDFFRGDALTLRNRPGRVLAEWREDLPGYGYVLGMYAFGLEEANEYALAEQFGRRALEIDPRDVWSVHAVTHVMEMQGRTEEGIEFLRGREADWGRDNGFTYHNWWHLALLYLEQDLDQGAAETVLEIYDNEIFDPDNDLAISLLDATAMLWRLQLLGVNVGPRFDAVADVWAAKLDVEPGFYAFNDFHAALAFVATDRADAFERVMAGMQHAGSTGGASNAAMSRDVGLPLLHALDAYRNRNFARAAERFESVRPIAHRFGGSHAQRDIVALTSLAASARAKDADLTRFLLHERAASKPRSVLGQRVVEAA